MKQKLVLFVAAISAVLAADAAGLDRSRFNIGTFCLKGSHRTEQMFRDIRECGVDFIVYDFFGDANAHRLMERHGLGCIEHNVVPFFFGGNTNNNGNIARLCPIEKYVASVRKHSFEHTEWMHHLGDELSAADFPHIGRAVLEMQRVQPNVPEFINLHPSWHSKDNVMRYLGVTNYCEYIATYCREMPIDFICYDHYPYQWLDRRDWAFARYYENFRIVADACTATGRSFWFIPQVNTIDESLEMTADKMRYQAYAAMSFGAECLMWACWSPGWWKLNVLDKDGNKTAQYERLTTVNAEIRRFADDYMRYRRVATHLVSFAGRAANWLVTDPGNHLPQLNFSVPEASTVSFKNVRPDDGLALVVGDFAPRAAGERSRAMFLFAAEDPFGEKPTERTVRFNSGRCVRAVGPHGSVPVERTGTTSCAVRLRSSECVFVISE